MVTMTCLYDGMFFAGCYKKGIQLALSVEQEPGDSGGRCALAPTGSDCWALSLSHLALVSRAAPLHPRPNPCYQADPWL